MSDVVNVRLATAADHQPMCALLDAVDQLHREGAPLQFCEPPVAPRPLEFFSELFQGRNAAALVADAGSVVGVALVLLRSAPAFPVFRQQSFAVLDVIAVDSAWRRRSVGTRLAAAATAWAESRGAAWLELGVYEFNREALAFYDALGFRTASRKLHKPLQR